MNHFLDKKNQHLLIWNNNGTLNKTFERGFLAKSGQKAFERLCSLDVLGLIDNADESNIEFHTDFKEQLQLKEDEFY